MKKNEENKIFNKALSDFVQDFASGDEIRQLADRGFSVSEIKERLSFPTSKEKIGQIMWEHFVGSGRICLEKPPENGKVKRTRTVREQGEFGRISFRQISEELEDVRKYAECDFGRLKRAKAAAFTERLGKLSAADRDYVIFLPWPEFPVWHEEDERIMRIISALGRD